MANKTTYQTEFPDFSLDVEIPKNWTDVSWVKNSCPSWQYRNHVIFIDYTDPTLRDAGCDDPEDNNRFSVYELDEEGSLHNGAELDFFKVWSNDFQDVLDYFDKN